MFVKPYNTLNKSYYTPTFTEYRGVKLDENGQILYRKDTCSFRHDLDFDLCVDFLDKKYVNSKDVEVWIHACSIGEGTYSLAAQMDSSLGARAEKFKPFKARDIDADNIRLAQNPVYKFHSYELSHANFQLKKPIDYYYKLIGTEKGYQKRVPAEILRTFVQFERSDILDDVKYMRPFDTVLSARNFWPYLKRKQALILAYQIAKRFDPSCTLILGDFDFESDMEYMLEHFLFKKTACKNVYEKTVKSLPSINNLSLYPEDKEFLAEYIENNAKFVLQKYLLHLKRILKIK